MEDMDFIDLLPRSFGNWSQDYLDQLDTSKYDFPNTLWHVKSNKEIAIKTTLMLAIGIPGLYLNFVILLVLVKNKWLWSASNILVGNLALVDFMILFFCPWLLLARDFYQNYVLREFGCRVQGFWQASLLLSNVGAVILVSYDRLAAAALTPDARVTKSCAPKLIGITWVASIALSVPWIVKTEYRERQWRNHLEKFCVEDPLVLNLYWHFIHTLLVWVPLGIMTITYGVIMWRLEKTARELKSRGGGQAMNRAKGRAMRVTACVLIADVLFRIPYSGIVYWRMNNNLEINSVDGPYAVLWFTAQYLMYMNSALNPLIYGFTNLRFRKAMDRTPGVACCKFGTWCCVCTSFKKKEVQLQDKQTEKIFVIESSPKPNRKISRIIKNFFHVNKDTIELSMPRDDEATTRPTKITPLKAEHI